MGLFTKSPEPEREESLEQVRSRRESELLETIRALDSQRDSLRSLIEVFRREHMVIVNDQITFATSELHGRDVLAAQWSALCAEASEIARRRDAALAEWSSLCSNPKETSHHAD
jgi:hypothetical protein